MKIYFFETDATDEAVLRKLIDVNGAAGQIIEAVFSSAPLNKEIANTAVDADAVSIFTKSMVDAAVLEKLTKIKFIGVRATGFDNIDLDVAASRNIIVSNVPAYGSRTVAEFTFSLILGLSRKTFAATRQIKERHDFAIADFEGFNLQGKTLGIVGTGRIGLNVAKIAKGFDMNVLGFDAFPNATAAKEIGFTYGDFDSVLAASDIISVHVPYMKTTHHLLNDAAFAKMKKGAILINTSRGEVIDTEALMRALDAKIVSAAGLDVIEGERSLADEWSMSDRVGASEVFDSKAYKTMLEDHMLMDRPEVYITPHIAFFSREAKQEILKTSADNIAGFLKNAPINVVPQGH